MDEKKAKIKTPAMERFGVWYMKKLREKFPPDRIDYQTHILDDAERAQIQRIFKKTILNAVLIGLASSVITSVVAFWAYPLYEKSTHIFSDESINYWVITMSVTIVASIIEIVFLYYDILRKTHAISAAAHQDLLSDDETDMSLINSLVRAALELPNPNTGDINIDPKKETSRIRLIISSILYKAKVTVTNFVLKALVKRMLGRAVSRAYLEFLAIPVISLWNGIVAWLVIREAKIRVLGPSAVMEMINEISDKKHVFSDKLKIALLRAVASCILTTADLHPNLEYLLKRLTLLTDNPENVPIDDSALFLNDLPTLSQNEQQIVIHVLVFASIIDGKITWNEKQLLKKAFAACNLNFDYTKIKKLIYRFRTGQMVGLKLNDF